ncbi:MAG: hypothetical protein FWD42_03600 [Solirubrobacterales bacterium]|nr:hypothetical protein [Solirubrobacterales bacterium]
MSPFAPRFLPAAVLAALVLAGSSPPPAAAEFSAATLLSGTAHQQFEEANAPVLSADGRYAVFQGTRDGVTGVWRRGPRGEVQAVAAGYDPQDPALGAPSAQLSAPDAAAPSVSREGRYVAFTTTADLDPADEPAADSRCPQVYVRNMEPAPGEPEYTLASALNGTSEGITYEEQCSGPAGEFSFYICGAQSAAGVALSADGQQVAFAVLSKSNLAGPGTERSQVAVRDLQSETTTLVTTSAENKPVAGGAFPSVQSLAQAGLGGRRVGLGATPGDRYGDQASASTAAISGDGSTVAWLGANVAAQVSAAEAQRSPRLAGYAEGGREVEPLWRRISGGPSAPTRRLLTGAGLNFFYNRINEPSDAVLAGSLVGIQESELFLAPALSFDGDTVGLVASAPAPAAEASLDERKTIGGISDLSTDVYAVHVSENAASPPAATPVTQVASYRLPATAIEDVKDVAISPEGTRLAFDTARTQFYLPDLALVSPPIAFASTAETYAANLALGTLQRVTSTYDGSEPNGEAGLLSYGGAGQGTLAFASRATNLFFGDGVNAWEAYEVRETPSSASPTPPEIGAQPTTLEQPTLAWRLTASATAEADGSVLVVVQAPGAGRVGVSAGAQLPVRSRTPSPARRAVGHARTTPPLGGAIRARPTGRSAKSVKRKAPTKKAHNKHGHGVAVPARTVAQAQMATQGPAEATLRLRVKAAYRRLVEGRYGLYAVLRVTFAAPGQKTLATNVPVTFHVVKRTAAAHRTRNRGRVKR